jgi:hypothetical protein
MKMGRWPKPWADRPAMEPKWAHLATSVPNRLRVCIYAVFQVGLIKGLTMDTLAYISRPLPPSLRHP